MTMGLHIALRGPMESSIAFPMDPQHVLQMFVVVQLLHPNSQRVVWVGMVGWIQLVGVVVLAKFVVELASEHCETPFELRQVMDLVVASTPLDWATTKNE